MSEKGIRGSISLSNLFRGIGSLIDLAARIEEEGKDEEKHTGELSDPSGRVKAIFGFSIKTALGERPTIEAVEPFRKAGKTPRGPVVEEEIQPFVDVFDERDHILVIVDLPGAEEEHIRIEVRGDILLLSTAGGNRNYAKEIVLPANVDADTLKSAYRNGVLEIRVSKVQHG